MLPEELTAALAARMERAWPGEPFPLGATWDGEGTDFSLWSSGATAVDVCLFNPTGRETRVPLHQATYQFVDQASLDRAVNGADLKRLVADFNRDWADVTRTRELLVLAEEFAG